MIENNLVTLYVLIAIIIGVIFGYILCNIIYKSRNSRKGNCRIIDRSNIIGYDDLGNPLRLCIVQYENGDYEQVWIDTNTRTSDVEIKWEVKDD